MPLTDVSYLDIISSQFTGKYLEDVHIIVRKVLIYDQIITEITSTSPASV